MRGGAKLIDRSPATIRAVKEYYEARAVEYDEWYLGRGRFAALERPHWDDDLRALEQTLAKLPRARTLDIACGTGFLTRHLDGDVTGLDQSERMLAIARERVPAATFVRADALRLPFDEDAFDRVVACHFYGHLEQPDRETFLAEARRVAPKLVVVDSAVRPDRPPEEWQERILNDGSRFRIYKRYFDAEALAAELGGGNVLLRSRWFVVIASSCSYGSRKSA